MFEQEYKPRLLKVDSIMTLERNITQPQDKEAVNHLLRMLREKTPQTFQELQMIVDDHGLSLFEGERSPNQQADLVGYRVVKKVDDNGNDIDPKDLEENLEKYMVLGLTLQIAN